jgi:hypothetical protein
VIAKQRAPAVRKLRLAILLFGTAVLAFAGTAGAATRRFSAGPAAGAAMLAPPGHADRARRNAMALLRDAAAGLDQAALQRDFASNASVLRLLQRAHDDLAAAGKTLCCAERTQAIGLAAGIDYAIARGSAQLGTLVSNGPDRFGPLPPSRNELAVLAKEGQQLVHDSLPALRAPDTDDIAWLRGETGPVSGRGVDPWAPAGEPPASLPGDSRAWPQLARRF